MTANVRISALLFTVLLIMGCRTADQFLYEYYEPLKGRDEVTVVVFGDSISGGRGFSESGTSYGSFMKSGLEELLDTRISMIVSCKEGATFNKAIRRVQEDIQSFRPDIVFLMLGFNDTLQRGLFEIVYKEQVNYFMKTLRDLNLNVIVLTSTGIRDITSTNHPAMKRLRDFNEITSYSAAYYHFPVIDTASRMESVLKRDPEEYRSMFTDTVHLNEKGQQFVADHIMESINRALERKRKQYYKPES